MTRVMVGDALVYEHERLQTRMNLFFDKFEAVIKQNLRDAALGTDATPAAAPLVDGPVRASVVVAFIAGRLQRFARSGFRRLPSEQLSPSLDFLLR